MVDFGATTCEKNSVIRGLVAAPVHDATLVRPPQLCHRIYVDRDWTVLSNKRHQVILGRQGA